MYHLITKAFLALAIISGFACAQNLNPIQSKGSISKNGMKLRWHFEGEDIVFQMEAPSTGWLAIGFNESAALPETYLLMACVTDGQVKAVEHKTLSAGDYRPISILGGKASLTILDGMEDQQKTTICVKVPQIVKDGFHKQLTAGSKWSLLLAFSREDDFQHHSMMRTSLPITL